MTNPTNPYAPHTAEARCQRFFDRLHNQENQIVQPNSTHQPTEPSQQLLESITLIGLSGLID